MFSYRGRSAVVMGMLLSGSLEPARGSGTFCYNYSYETQCAEEDNLTFSLGEGAPVEAFLIRATHPTYAVSNYDCPANFENCPPPGECYPFEPETLVLFDDGQWIVVAYRLDCWWQPQGMTASAIDGPSLEDAHYIAVSKKIEDEDSWPQFLVFYSDAYLRLIPHPPPGAPSVCFGSSVIVGPVELAGDRPYAGVAEVVFDAAEKRLLVSYEPNGTAVLAMNVDRTKGEVFVQDDYTGFTPFGALRSMYVEEGNCDAERIAVFEQREALDDTGVLEFSAAFADEFYFYRSVASEHNPSAPDIRIIIDTDGDGMMDYGDPCPDRIPGDVTGDGVVDPQDVVAFASVLVAPEQWTITDLCAADLNCDGEADGGDVQPFLGLFLAEQPPPPCGF